MAAVGDDRLLATKVSRAMATEAVTTKMTTKPRLRFEAQIACSQARSC